MKMTFLQLLLIPLALTACGESGSGDKPGKNNTVDIDPVVLTFTHDGGSDMIRVKSKREWTAYTDDDEWIKLTFTAGTQAEGTVAVAVAANPDTVARRGTVVMKSGAARAVCTVSQEAAPSIECSDLCPLEGYRLVWRDEFDRDGILRGDWSYQTAHAGWVNNELQTYVDQTSPKGQPVAECAQGKLRIHCFKEDGMIYSGRVYACRNKGWKYGYFEASIRLPKGKGTWPAFWMMPVAFTSWPGDGEIDIMEEVGVDANWTSSSIHTAAYNHVKGTQKTAKVYTKGAEDDFHTYGLEWTPDYIRSYVDGKPLLYFPNDGKNNKDTWPYYTPFYLILNVAWGGDWGGYAGVDDNALPVDMEVDYVRVFQKP